MPADCSECARYRAAGAAAGAAARSALQQPECRPARWRYTCRDRGDARPLLEHNVDRAMNPASTMKLVTTLAGLELLGPNYMWRTEAWLDGTLTGDVLEGNLVLKGYGDPEAHNGEFLAVPARAARARAARDPR